MTIAIPLLIFLAVFFGVIVGVVLLFVIIFFSLKKKLNDTIGTSNMALIKDRISEGVRKGEIFDGDFEADQKSISGMTELLEPKIRNDFDDFQASELFNLNNKNLKAIFNALEERSIEHIDHDRSFDLIKANIYEQIQDMIGNDIEETYDNVRINKNSIKSYENKDGSAYIEVNTSLSYFYTTTNKKKRNYDKFRKETRYTTRYILVYDEERFDTNKVSYAVNCPNCGAPVPTKGDTTCKFCGSHVEGVDFKTINLKGWKLISYKEY